MSSESKTSFDLELNPFERSFAPKEHSLPNTASSSTSNVPTSKPELNNTSSSSSKNSNTAAPNSTTTPEKEKDDKSKPSNKHNLRISNFPSVNGNSLSDRFSALTPTLFTPGGRRLPPIHLSPNAPMPNPETPGSMWGSLLNATNGHVRDPQNAHFSSMAKRSGLTPNESNLRSGLTPGFNHQGFNFGSGLTPGGLMNGQMTPGLSNLLGFSSLPHSRQGQEQAAPAASTNDPVVPEPQPMAPPAATGASASEAGDNASASLAPAAPTAPGASATQPAPAAPAAPAAAPGDTANSGPPAMPIPAEVPEPVMVNQPAANQPPVPVVVKREAEKDETLAEEPQAKKAKAAPKKVAKKKPQKAPEKEAAGAKSDNEDDASPDEKRKQFLERNRVAASKCRQRKKQLFQKMEDELAYFSQGHRELSAQVVQLREQILTLRGIIIQHKDCPALLQSVGGPQQLHNILGQTDYVSQMVGQQNYAPMPSTIPTTLKPGQHSSPDQFSPTPPQPEKHHSQSPHQPQIYQQQYQPPPQHPPQPPPQHQQQPPQPQQHEEHMPEQLAGQMSAPRRMPNMVQVNYQNSHDAEHASHDIQRHYSAGMVPADVVQEMDNRGGNLRSVNSLSNLQSGKYDENYRGLRNVSSMANLQGSML